MLSAATWHLDTTAKISIFVRLTESLKLAVQEEEQTVGQFGTVPVLCDSMDSAVTATLTKQTQQTKAHLVLNLGFLSRSSIQTHLRMRFSFP